jgi:hypothetical protein
MAGTEIILSPAPELQPAPLFTPTPKAGKRVLEFFTAQVNKRPHPQAQERALSPDPTMVLRACSTIIELPPASADFCPNCSTILLTTSSCGAPSVSNLKSSST